MFVLLHAIKAVLHKLDTIIETWGDTMCDMVLVVRKMLDDVMCLQVTECFEQKDWQWVDIIIVDGIRFENGEMVEMFLELL